MDKLNSLVNTYPFFPDDETAERFAKKLSQKEIGILHNICEAAYWDRHNQWCEAVSKQKQREQVAAIAKAAKANGSGS